MFVRAGARDLLLKGERQKFLAEEWPRVAEKIQRLGLTQRELDAAAAKRPFGSAQGKLSKSAKGKER
jgi:GntR family transcriptional regulator